MEIRGLVSVGAVALIGYKELRAPDIKTLSINLKILISVACWSNTNLKSWWRLTERYCN